MHVVIIYSMAVAVPCSMFVFAFLRSGPLEHNAQRLSDDCEPISPGFNHLMRSPRRTIYTDHSLHVKDSKKRD